MNTTQMNAITQLTGKESTRDKSVSKSEIQSLIPNTCSKALTALAELMQRIVGDGVVTRGEYLRVQGEMQRINLMMGEEKKLQDLLRSGKTISTKKKGPGILAPDVPEVSGAPSLTSLDF